MKNSKVKLAINKRPASLATLAEYRDESGPAVVSNRGTAQVARFTKAPDKIAESDHWVRVEPIPHGLELFPQEWNLRYADLFYPTARGGGLYIDTPVSPFEVMACERKLEAYRKKGVRYTFIKTDEDASEAMIRLDPTLPLGAVEVSHA